MTKPAKKTLSIFMTAVLLFAFSASCVFGTSGSSDKSFTDTSGHKYEKYILKATELKLFSGFEDGSFRPDATVTRAQFVTVLWRMKGSPESTVIVPFTDISGINSSYKKAIAWAYEKNVVSGTSDTTFDPSGIITRQQALTILYRLDGENSGLESMFTSLYAKSISDYYDISSYAQKGTLWAVYNGIAEAENGKLQPKAGCSRALLSVYLVKYLEDSAISQTVEYAGSIKVTGALRESLKITPDGDKLTVTYSGDVDEGSSYIAILIKGDAAIPTYTSTCACDIKTVSKKESENKSITFSLYPDKQEKSTEMILAIVSTDIAFTTVTVQVDYTVAQ